MKKLPKGSYARLAPLASPDHKPVVVFETDTLFEAWLDENHLDCDGIWIRFLKIGSGLVSINYAGALDVALCFGWIDGPIRRGDEHSWLHKFTPRSKRSVWSEVNKSHIERLIQAGRMRPAGMAAVESAKADGRWDAAYASSSTFKESPEFLSALKKSKKAAAFYATLSKANRYAFYFRLHTAKKPETKARKLAEFIAMLERGETFQ